MGRAAFVETMARSNTSRCGSILVLLLAAAVAGFFMTAFISPGRNHACDDRQVADRGNMALQRSLVRRGAMDSEQKRRELERELGKQDLGPVLNFIKGIQDYTKRGTRANSHLSPSSSLCS